MWTSLTGTKSLSLFSSISQKSVGEKIARMRVIMWRYESWEYQKSSQIGEEQVANQLQNLSRVTKIMSKWFFCFLVVLSIVSAAWEPVDCKDKTVVKAINVQLVFLYDRSLPSPRLRRSLVPPLPTALPTPCTAKRRPSSR